MNDEESSMSVRKPWIILALGILFAFSAYLAINRIYQIDECQNAYTARILASGWTGRFNVNIELFHLWPLAWLASVINGSSDLYHGLRIFMLLVFWLNIGLAALACGIPWKDRAFPWVLLGAATLTPLWDYGFEIRHDNVLLLVLLLFWNVLRSPRHSPVVRSILLGALAALMQFVTFKAFVYWIPLSALYLLFPLPQVQASRSRIFLLWLAGFTSACIAVLTFYLLRGELHRFLPSIGIGLKFSGEARAEFYPWFSLWRLVYQTPLLSGLAVAAAFMEALRVHRRRSAAVVWEGAVPEAILFVVAFGVLCINPAPYPYNLVLLVPFGFILAVRWSSEQESLKAFTRSGSMVLFVSLVVFTHGMPFVKSTLRHLYRTNTRQEQLMALAESLTDPARDRIYDACGLVASRESAARQWFLHGLLRRQVREGVIPSLKKALEDSPATVILPNYRFTWLDAEEKAFLQANYLMPARDFFILGAQIPPSRPTYRCLHPGRYFLTGPADGTVILDGKPVQVPSAVQLTQGDHAFASGWDQSLTISWLGPNLAAPPPVGTGDYVTVFLNWY